MKKRADLLLFILLMLKMLITYMYKKKSAKFVSNKSILRLNAYELNCDLRYMLLFYIV